MFGFKEKQINKPPFPMPRFRDYGNMDDFMNAIEKYNQAVKLDNFIEDTIKKTKSQMIFGVSKNTIAVCITITISVFAICFTYYQSNRYWVKADGSVGIVDKYNGNITVFYDGKYHEFEKTK